jgi:hypothetical protein
MLLILEASIAYIKIVYGIAQQEKEDVLADRGIKKKFQLN